MRSIKIKRKTLVPGLSLIHFPYYLSVICRLIFIILTCLTSHRCCIFESMKKEVIEYSRLVRMFCTPSSFPLNEGEMNALKKADTFTVRFEDWDLPCSGVALGFKFQRKKQHKLSTDFGGCSLSAPAGG